MDSWTKKATPRLEILNQVSNYISTANWFHWRYMVPHDPLNELWYRLNELEIQCTTLVRRENNDRHIYDT
jgi:hypothetical protein